MSEKPTWKNKVKALKIDFHTKLLAVETQIQIRGNFSAKWNDWGIGTQYDLQIWHLYRAMEEQTEEQIKEKKMQLGCDILTPEFSPHLHGVMNYSFLKCQVKNLWYWNEIIYIV